MSSILVRRAVRAVAAAAALSAGLAACTSSGSTAAPSPTTSGQAIAENSGAHAGAVTITSAKGCELDTTRFAAGGITFTITNKDAIAVSEVELLSGDRILGEKENVAAGLGGQFAVKVDAGTYTLYCPGAAVEKRTITVTGKAAEVADSVAGLIRQGTSDYKTYVDAQIGYLVQSVAKLDTALHGKNLLAAQRAYIAARPFYEKVEPVAESFVDGKQNLDAEIDARENNVPASQWSGFHLIEKSLFQTKSLAGMAKWGELLVTDVHLLQQKAGQLSYAAPDLANGAQGLLDEVAATKITGEEERYSHIDMLDMANNIEGAQQAFAGVQPALATMDPALASSIAGQFASLAKLINTYRTGGNTSGYRLYGTLTDADRRTLSAAVKAAAEPLSQVSGKLANA